MPAEPGVLVPPPRAGRRPRVALYGHDTVGLGHLRRNLALAAAMVVCPGGPQPDVLVLSGSPTAGAFTRPAGVDVVALPEVGKPAGSGYRPGSLRSGLGTVLDLRSAVLGAALAQWQPDLLVVDKVPRGLGGELEPALRALRRGGRTRTVLGLREVLDDPVTARREWQADCSESVVRELYDEIWVYGDPGVHDLTHDIGLPADLRARTRFTGYLSAGRATGGLVPPCVPRGRDAVLGLVGGGEDGGALARAFAAAPVPEGCTGVLVTGPYLSRAERQELEAAAAGRSDLVVVPFTEDAAAWGAGSAAVVTMGGYNSVAELLATDTPALVVPRVSPRREQLVRARSLAGAGAVDLMLPERATPAALGRWTALATAGPRRRRSGIDLDGLAWVARRTDHLLSLGALPAGRVATRTQEDRRAAV